MAYRVSCSSMHVACSLKYNFDLVMFLEMDYWRLMAACITVAVMACKPKGLGSERRNSAWTSCSGHASTVTLDQ